MKTLSKLFMACFLSMGLAACSSDDDPMGGGNELQNADKVYMKFTLSYPTTRSQTDDNGNQDNHSPSNADPEIEIGQDFENKISTIQLVLLDKTKKVQIVSNQGHQKAGDNYVVTFNSDDLQKIAGQDVKAYVVCNGFTDANIVQNIFTGDANIPNIWKNNNFLMTNAEPESHYTCSLPANFNNNKKPDTPFELNSTFKGYENRPIKVERAAARLDFKQTTIKGVSGANIYPIKEWDSATDKPKEENSGIQIELMDMALVNQSNAFYYLRRVSATNTGDGAVIGGLETSSNYVVDTDWDAKRTINKAEYEDKGFAKNNIYLNQNLYTFDKKKNVYDTPTELKFWTKITDITGNTSWVSGENPATGINGTYKAWKYTTENTSPLNYKQIQEGVATCIIFKGKMTAAKNLNTSNPNMNTALTANEPLYVLNNKLYGTWKMVEEASKNDNTVKTAYDNAIIYATADSENGGKKPGEKGFKIFNRNAKDAGFTVYDAVTDATGKYYHPVYYYYWNKHNDGNPLSETTPMHYGVVRNNVYKLAVTNILRYGHPFDSDGDPDPVEPDQPINKDKVYFKVSVAVLPWTVRVNNIEF